jgi:hypothetical protein
MPGKLYFLGVVLIAIGVGCIQQDTINKTRESIVWSEADKAVIGEDTNPAG